MGVLSKLLGPVKAVREARPHQQLIIHFFYGSTYFQYVYALEDLLRIAISEASAGEYDGREMADDGDGRYIDDPDAEALYQQGSAPARVDIFIYVRATVTLQFGPPKRKTPKRVIELP